MAMMPADGLAGRSVDRRNGAGHAGFDLQLIRILAQLLVDLRLLTLDGLFRSGHIDGRGIAEILFENKVFKGLLADFTVSAALDESEFVNLSLLGY